MDASGCASEVGLDFNYKSVMDYQNEGVAKALGTLFLVLSSFPPPARSFPDLPKQTLEQKGKFHKRVGC